MTVGFWFRRDLRVTDNPALLRAAADGEVLPFFIRDRSVRMATFRRRRFEAALRRLDEQIRAQGGAGLWIMEGEFTAVLALLQAQGVSSVFATGEYTPRGRRRDVRAHVAARAAGMDLEFHDSPYLHAPGEVRKPDGSRYQVFTPYYRAWLTLPKPEPESGVVVWWHDRDLPQPVDPGLPDAGPMVLLSTLLDERLARYSDCRDRLDLDCTSHLSEPLHFGELHPRTVWQAAAGQPGSEGFLRELAWREFFADALGARDSAWQSPGADQPDMADDWHEDFEAWREGRTGYPVVDAGMRQLLETGRMHNRVRMIVASFLCKDLLIHWQPGARHFLEYLRDADVASNNMNWQWVAGIGPGSSAYYRVFNPVRQGLRFDPDGDYVRRFVPELRACPGASVHEPWQHPQGYADGYPQRIVDHDEARTRYLDSQRALRGQSN